MTRTWIDAIYDRTYGNVQSLQMDPDQIVTKGAWNAEDLNRIEKNTAYCAEYMLEMKIVRTPPEINVREDDYWTKDMIPTKPEIDRILNNVRLLVELSRSNPAIASDLPDIYAATQINYVFANQIEFALELIHTQPKLPLQYWKLTLEAGLVTTIIRDGGVVEVVNASEALVAEDEIVTILGTEYGEYAQFQTFTYWSGKAEDIGLLENYKSKQTTFQMPYRDVDFVANFETHVPRTLKINNGYISTKKDPNAESGPNTGTYLAGEEVMIISNVAVAGKAFYEWQGTEEALENIVGVTSSEDPSTAILTMPDCDVELTPLHINAGQHSVTVNNGSGGGWYNYRSHVSIRAKVPDHYAFSHWSGNTSYLEDIYKSSQSFRMGDVNISFTAHFNYVYSYNDVQVIDGLIRVNGEDVEKAESVREASVQTLVPTPPDETQGLDYWSIEGAGAIKLDYLGNHTNNFVVGDGNAIVTGHYNTLRTLTLNNLNRSGSSTSSKIVQGHMVRASTNEIVGDYIFDGWTAPGSGITPAGGHIFDFEMFEYDVTLEAVYRLRHQVSIVINYGTHTETITMQERASKTITADPAPAGKHFLKWSYSGLYDFGNTNATTTSFVAGSGHGVITAVYEDDFIYYNLTVNQGSGSGRVKQGAGQIIDANQAPDTYEFDYWEIIKGNGTIDNIYSKRTTFRMGTKDAEIKAHYKPIPYFTVNIENGYIWDGNDWTTSATLLRNSTNAIKMKPAPTGMLFLQWEVYVDGVLQTDANDVSQPLAEHSSLRNLLRDATIKATYYVPDPDVKYVLTIERKDGSVDQRDYAAGTDVTIRSSSPDEGMEFYKWEGDTAYIAGGIYNRESYVHMPAQNIKIKERFEKEGFIPEFDVVMTNIYGQCCYVTTSENPETGEITETEHWVSRRKFTEGTTVKIRATGYDAEYYFAGWTAKYHDTQEDAREIIENLNDDVTTIVVPAYDVDIEPIIAIKDTYSLTVIDGQRSGTYYEGKRADIYFDKENTNDIHYVFTRWTGEKISELELYDGGMFDVTVAGNEAEPQYIKMPARAVEVKANYKTLHRFTLTDGIINETEETEGFYEPDTKVEITANPAPEGMKFQYWEGDTDVLDSKYDPTTFATTVVGVTVLKAVYSTDANKNGVGYVETNLKETTTINNNDISIISGVIEVGFLITDINGHIYIVTSVDEANSISTIYRMTKVVQGGNIYG